jgi:hypothetical protein
MEIIPCIALKNYNIKNQLISSETISQFIKEGEKLYILDLDGIEKNKPNLCFYQKISNSYDLWIDCRPRNIGDIVDIFMTGATSVTIRRDVQPSFNISDIKDISENNVYLNLNINDNKSLISNDLFLKDSDGFVIFNKKEEIEQEKEFSKYLNDLQIQNKIYCYENNVNNCLFWEGFGAKGLIVDINKLKEFENGLRK